ncbi:Hypothetical predicted protein [Octopus vulgaris]|uniref:G-protein coupled receptors family 1 profile domain-containing protein n=1 Tax=Octopus vulgaris TaxID=6645 RepID=A0AA36B193_OCTVU|nr:Hypothetical predicted protein [Octopus vulgaris]
MNMNEESESVPSNGSLPEMLTVTILSTFNDSMGENSERAAQVFRAHSLIVSMFALAFTAVVGFLSSSVVITTLAIGRLIKDHYYILLATLLIIAIIFNVIWSPLEIICLLMYHNGNTLFLSMKETTHSLFLLLIATKAGLLFLIALWFLLSEYGCSKACRKFLVYIGLPLVLSIGFAVGILYGVLSYSYELSADSQSFYHILNSKSYLMKILVLTILIGLLLIKCLLFLAVKLKQKTIEKPRANSVASTSEHSITLPTLTPSDSGGEYKELKSKPLRKNSHPPNQLLVSNNPSGVTQGDPQTHKKNSFSFNSGAFLQMFGRRRHTICQFGEIGDNGYTDHQTQAQGYQYVRKFSVDIAALQAQLEDPKSHSSISSFKSAEDLPPNPFQQPSIRTPSSIEEASTSFKSIGKKSSAPPRITVESVVEEESHPSISKEIHNVSMTQCYKTCVILLISFLVSIMPVYLTEAIRSLISVDSYINSLICTTALSGLSTVIFPLTVIFTDATVYKAFRTMLSQCCLGADKDTALKETQSMLPSVVPSDSRISQL